MLEQLTAGQDPYPMYEQMRANGPLHRDPAGTWVSTSHEVVNRILRDRRFGTRVIAAANRDPDTYPDPNRFDILRDQRPEHLAFSSGVHYCLGATLARMEGDVAFRALATRMPGLRQAGPVEYRESTVIRGPARFPVSRS